MMRGLYFLALLVLALGGQSAQAAKPNVLFFVVDDLNTGVGAFGDDLADTPHIDGLLGNGTTFTNAHVIKSECSPSRATMFTGRLPDMNRVWDFEPRLRHFNPTLMTLPGLFREQGYRTVAFGKVFDSRSFKKKEKLDLCESSNSTICSWDKIASLEDMEKDARNVCGIKKLKYSWSKKQKKKNRGKLAIIVPDKKAKYTSDHCSATAAGQELRDLAVSGTPFFLAVGFSLPHMPWVYPRSYASMLNDISDKELVDRVAGDTNSSFFEEQTNTMSNSGSYEITRYSDHESVSTADRIRHYYRSVSYMDDQLGRVLDVLDETGLEDVKANTLIVFASDNGFHLGDHGIWGKKTLYDRATRVPLAIVPPSTLLETQPALRNGLGAEIPFPVQIDDVFPTVLELCGIENDDVDHDRSGVSLVPSMQNTTKAVRSAAVSQFWAHAGEGMNRKIMGYSLRTVHARYTRYMAFSKNIRSTAITTTLYDPSQGEGVPEFFDYAIDGSRELANRANESAFERSVELLQSEIMANGDRGWTSLHGAIPFDARS
ncbi:Iduronate 2-sulfatase [Hondaea fermentalgiana]|uniref:Iduronate 2-sulfatase n=1 Tax=Hondaea fermentalgiana TaxID=2315210 RepID=A0A2R5GEB5_9STRA|nr:Iduronate 2-sulfatase [Hondaea fermentalgiana]|eukprot:GBG26154.1 Iduronate 2-sulfatase [Hondaea fermentalgiana]